MKYFLLLSFSLFISCDFLNQSNAVEYNDIIINCQSDIVKKFVAIGNAFEKQDSIQMYQCQAALNTTIDSAIKVVSELSSLDGSTEMKDAALHLFNYYKNINQRNYSEIISILLLPNPSEDDLERLSEVKAEIVVGEESLDNELELAQKHMSEKYGFSLEKKEN